MTTYPQTFTKTEAYTIIWVLFSIALVVFISRIWIRFKIYSYLKIDDYLVILAFLCLLTANIIQAVQLPKAFTVQDVRAKLIKPPPDYLSIQESYARTQWATAYLFFTGTWAVKGSFLAFYDSLTQRLTLYRRLWWAIIVLTILTYIGSLFAYAFLDGLQLNQSSHKNEAIIYQFSADVITDILITAVPLTLALKSRVPTKQKLTLAGIFSLTLIITIFSVIRFSLNNPSHVYGPSWIIIWSDIEQSVSVIIACLASFRTWVIAKDRSADRFYERHHNQNRDGSTPQRMRAVTDKYGFFRSLGNSERTDDAMDIELLDSRSGVMPTARAKVEEPADAAVTPMGAKVEEPADAAVTPMGAKGLNSMSPL